MSGELGEILSRLPPFKRLSLETCEFLDKEIRRGVDLNLLQREGILDVVQFCLEQGLTLPSPYESYWAYVYQEWAEEAKLSEEIKKKLLHLVQKLKANPGLASTVAQTVQHVQKEKALRRQEAAKLAKSLAESIGSPLQTSKRGSAKEPPNVYVSKMQGARLGQGENPVINLELAVQIAEEAVDAYPNSPKVLFEAAGCHQLLAQTGTRHSSMVRYVHMKEAYALYQQILIILANQPYATLKGEYDVWRKGLADLIPKVQQELAILEEQQR